MLSFYQQDSIVNAAAEDDHESNDNADSACKGIAFDVSQANYGSVHCVWAGLAGTLDGQFVVEVCNEPTKTKWVAKAGATLTPSTADGSDVIALNGVISEQYYRVRWDANNVSDGTVSAYFVAKG